MSAFFIFDCQQLGHGKICQTKPSQTSNPSHSFESQRSPLETKLSSLLKGKRIVITLLATKHVLLPVSHPAIVMCSTQSSFNVLSLHVMHSGFSFVVVATFVTSMTTPSFLAIRTDASPVLVAPGCSEDVSFNTQSFFCA